MDNCSSLRRLASLQRDGVVILVEDDIAVEEASGILLEAED